MRALPLLVLEIGLALGECFSCLALAELFAATGFVAVDAIAVAIGVAVVVVINDVGGVSELGADGELLSLRRGWACSHERACCEAG
jgi:hypothetical protein